MKKLLYAGLFITALASTVSSCKKDDEKTTTTKTLSKGWKINDKQFDQSFCMGMNAGAAYILVATTEMPSGGDDVNRFLVHFKTRPSSDKSYKVVYKPEFTDMTDDEVYVLIGEKDGDMESVAITEGNEGKMATVKIEGGKLNVTIPKVAALRGPSTGSHNESVTIEGNMVEQ